jgi:catechol 2,3-dioxygenase-like lactoylglutathione lyase family enzyme
MAMTAPEPAAIGELAYLYVGTDDLDRDRTFYIEALGAAPVWRFQAFATDVAAVRFGSGSPLVLLAEHRPAPSCLPIWVVTDLDAAVARLSDSDFESHGETVGTPDGPVHVLQDPSGNQIGLLQQDRPNALAAAYEDPTHENAVRD